MRARNHGVNRHPCPRPDGGEGRINDVEGCEPLNRGIDPAVEFDVRGTHALSGNWKFRRFEGAVVDRGIVMVSVYASPDEVAHRAADKHV